MASDQAPSSGSSPDRADSLPAGGAQGRDAVASLPLTTDDLPALFTNSDYTAVSAQRRYLGMTRLRLILLVAAAVAGAVTISWFGFAGAALLLTAAIIELDILRDRPDRRWYEGRAAAESAKTLGWRYAVGGAPFALGAMPERETDRLLIDRLEEILTDLGDLSFDPRHSAAEQITPAMRAMRATSLDHRKAVYESGRIGNQIDWYSSNSARNERQARRLTLAVLAFEVLGAVGGLLHAIKSDLPNINALAVAAAAAAAVGAWLQAKQHQTVARAYAVAALELSSIRSLIRWQETEADWANFVDEAETAISREHTLWRANRGMRPAARPPKLG
jgi:SMODS and SLOG-associating 2TM effector domain 3/SMODS and SLOG-associating 2TM effector domain 1